ncbi:peptidase domain-containing ABC transporter [Anditalea andensis]|uniref:ABC transporter ATP-binding protein n=1 Tax=Anditalea andensis TaxID=1048983 RepID=A0A074LF89_9BACT|nr:ATP-binding cassette domain-containing protein [Anditalea andensis]KEO72452.1 ABC transporter ATP-binding protein [Anditalea andensis]
MKIVNPALTPMRRFAKLLREEKRDVYAIYFYAILNGAVALILPLGIQALFNFILGGRVSTSWMILVAVVAAGIAFSGFLQISQLYLTEKLQQRIFTKSALSFAYRFPRLKLDELQNKFPPELVNRFFDTLNLQKGTAKLLIDLPTALLQVFFGLILLAFYHPYFILFGFILILLVFIVFYFTSPKGMETALKESSAKYNVAFWLEEIARALPSFKLSGNSKLPLLKVDFLLQKYVDFRNKHFKVLMFQYKVLIVFKVLIVTTLLGVGSLLLINEEISIGQFVAAEIIIILVIGSVEKLILSLEVVYDTLTAVEKVGLIMDIPIEKQTGTEKAITKTDHGLKFEAKNLSYKSNDNNLEILDNLNFVIHAGEKVVITGESGSGKSTLLHLLSGLFENYTGKIIINDLPLDVLDVNKIRGYIGESFDHQSIFHGTIRENITLGKEVTESKLREIVEIVGLTDYIYHLPGDMDTVLMPEARGLSKNLLRKIIISRCLVGMPRAILLEDLWSALNVQADPIIDYIFKGDWTTFFISNDEELMMRADKIIVMDKGKINFIGSSAQYKDFKNGN